MPICQSGNITHNLQTEVTLPDTCTGSPSRILHLTETTLRAVDRHFLSYLDSEMRQVVWNSSLWNTRIVLPYIINIMASDVDASGQGIIGHGPLTRYVKLRVAHVPGLPGTFSPPTTSKETASQRSQHASRHVRHARAVMHAGIANPRWWGKLSRHPRPMCDPQLCIWQEARDIDLVLPDIPTSAWDMLT